MGREVIANNENAPQIIAGRFSGSRKYSAYVKSELVQDFLPLAEISEFFVSFCLFEAA